MEENMMKPQPHCPVIGIDGFISNGKQFDLDITLPDVCIKKYQKFIKTNRNSLTRIHFKPFLFLR